MDQTTWNKVLMVPSLDSYPYFQDDVLVVFLIDKNVTTVTAANKLCSNQDSYH